MGFRGLEINKRSGWSLYILVIGLLAALLAGGYLLFRTYALNVKPDPGAYGLLALAVAAGVAGFFSPCVFPMLPGYLSVYYAADKKSSDVGSIGLGASAALGVTTFNLLLGALIGLLGAGLTSGLAAGDLAANPALRIFRGVVGVVMIGLGVRQIRGRGLNIPLAESFVKRVRPQGNDSERKPGTTLYLYGLGYPAAGLCCTGPILAGLVIFALSAGGFAAGLSTFAVYTATMAALMLLVSALAATSQETMLRRLKESAPGIERASAVLLVLAGLFNLVGGAAAIDFARLVLS